MALSPPIDPATSSPVQLTFGSPARQRRLTVFFRFILLIPQIIVLFFVGIAAYVVLIVGWFAALFTGQLPQGIATFLTGFVRWNTRLVAYEYLLTDKYPPFSLDPSADYPVDLEVHTGRLNRWSVLFRYFLSIPGFIAVALLTYGMQIFAIVNWLVTLVKGEQPPMFFEAYAASIRYYTRMIGFFFMLTSVYPADVLGDDPPLGDFENPAPGFPPVPPTGVPGFEGAPPPAPPPSPAPSPLVIPDLTAPSPPSAPVPPSAIPAPSMPGLAPPPPGAPPFGAPPPYPGPAPAYQEIPAERRSSLVLSSGARKLVVAFFILGALGIAAYSIFFVTVTSKTVNRLHAQNQAVTAYNTAVVSVRSFASTAKACTQGSGSDATEVACLEANDATLATVFDRYAGALSTIDFPADATAEAAAAQSAASAAAATMRQLSTAGTTAASYQAAVNSSNITAAFNEVDSTFHQLNSTLING